MNTPKVSGKWSLDKKISVSAAVTLFLAMAGWAYQSGGMAARLDGVESRLGYSAKKIERVAEDVSGLKVGQNHIIRALDKIDKRLDNFMQKDTAGIIK